MFYILTAIVVLLIGCFLLLRSILLILIDTRDVQLRLKKTLTGTYFEEEFEYDEEAPETSSKEEVDANLVSEHVLERERVFNERIERMKSELNIDVEKRGTEAEILHPDVENLPHDSVRPAREEGEEYAK